MLLPLKIILIILILRQIILGTWHLMTFFSEKTIQSQVDLMLNDPYRYVKLDNMTKFFYDVMWLVVFSWTIVFMYKI